MSKRNEQLYSSDDFDARSTSKSGINKISPGQSKQTNPANKPVMNL